MIPSPPSQYPEPSESPDSFSDCVLEGSVLCARHAAFFGQGTYRLVKNTSTRKLRTCSRPRHLMLLPALGRREDLLRLLLRIKVGCDLPIHGISIRLTLFCRICALGLFKRDTCSSASMRLLLARHQISIRAITRERFPVTAPVGRSFTDPSVHSRE